jgi:simple sugar transport system ATP-binding protein
MSPAAGAAGSLSPAERAARKPLLEARNISKYFGAVVALEGVSLPVRAGEINCLLGDNGAGKSTLIKTLSGVHPPDDGTLAVDGEPITFASPRDALNAGIATVYQDLSVMPLMSISRNFFLGNEPTVGWGPFKRFDSHKADTIAREEMHNIGIDVRDTEQLVGTLSGGERQTLAIARAEYFGARVLLLDEPTSALGVKQSGVVLKYTRAAADRGLGVIFITHNPNHAIPVGDRFLLLNRGHSLGDFAKDEISRQDLTRLMAGGAELEQLEHEIGIR